MYTIRLSYLLLALTYGSLAHGQAYVGETSGIWIGGVHHTCTVISPAGQLHCVPSGK